MNTTSTDNNTSDVARERSQDAFKPLPVWVRAPVTGPEHYSGLTRAKLYQLDREEKIRSVSIQEPGQSRGCRLFHLGSVLRFIEQFERKRVSAGPSATTL
jgi:hypothetical protein